MKIFISADIEGISSIVHGIQTKMGSEEYEKARYLMTQEVNAAIDGALEGGAKEILVNDSHGGMRNLLVEDLREEATVILGKPKKNSMMAGLDHTFDGVFCIGYHPMAKNNGTLAHTISGYAFSDIEINGKSYGESGIYGALAGSFGVPVVLFSGDDVLEMEVKRDFPKGKVAVVKDNLGNHCAKCIHPNKARKLIKEKAKEALKDLKEMELFQIKGPLDMKIKLNSVLIADCVEIIPRVNRYSSDTITYKAEDIQEGVRLLNTISAMARGLM
ncbi:MAG: M55 family metallopeptidase [Marinisporobacter sp.]|jgi:D-amino peptidase|nr:M55 family metallopeptidase [Marinisporobacter sp.]